jgi:hypothetical protein
MALHSASATTYLPGQGPSAPTSAAAAPKLASATCPLAEGKAYKLANETAVYYVTAACTRRPFLNAKGYFSYFSSWHDFKIVQLKDMFAVPLDPEGTMPYKKDLAKNDAAPYRKLDLAHYTWLDKVDFKRYPNWWKKITTTRLAGFYPMVVNMVEKTWNCSSGGLGSDSGGRCHSLEVRDSNKYKWVLDSPKKLKAFYAPVESQSEAASFVALMATSTNIDAYDRLVGFTEPVEEGYLVHITKMVKSKCGTQEPLGQIIRITKEGDMKLIAYEKPSIKLDKTFPCPK